MSFGALLTGELDDVDSEDDEDYVLSPGGSSVERDADVADSEDDRNATDLEDNLELGENSSERGDLDEHCSPGDPRKGCSPRTCGQAYQTPQGNSLTITEVQSSPGASGTNRKPAEATKRKRANSGPTPSASAAKRTKETNETSNANPPVGDAAHSGALVRRVAFRELQVHPRRPLDMPWSLTRTEIRPASFAEIAAERQREYIRLRDALARQRSVSVPATYVAEAALRERSAALSEELAAVRARVAAEWDEHDRALDDARALLVSAVPAEERDATQGLLDDPRLVICVLEQVAERVGAPGTAES